jgi:hypothetical protein
MARLVRPYTSVCPSPRRTISLQRVERLETAVGLYQDNDGMNRVRANINCRGFITSMLISLFESEPGARAACLRRRELRARQSPGERGGGIAAHAIVTDSGRQLLYMVRADCLENLL